MIDNYKVKVRNELIQSAKYRKQVEYLIVSYVIGQDQEDRQAIDKVLYDVSLEEYKNGNPMLWPLVVDEATGLPAEGFFKLLAELDQMKESDDRSVVYKEKLEEVFSYWAQRRKTGKSGTKRKF